MEDDDEFGDLYTDVLRPFASVPSSSAAPEAQQGFSAPPSLHRPIDLNLRSDDDEILYGAGSSNSAAPNRPSDQTLAPRSAEPTRGPVPASGPILLRIWLLPMRETRI
ncbi:hypothetical protein CJ030_MR1G018419 [Morella rubra]|uniref:Uncharacterized protein n=1 Tax=Morella rubra TaxID=262757 RepID=A0A6A1WLH2_9ROSI|nr:hypothetical protein CJ030_MR1G018413 [Morella rubra]KAB1226000.1 hypothetical protein CJ030_MR1G018419 [Morella rubra]